MSIASHHRFDLSEQQATFMGLLQHPLVCPWNQSRLHSLVSRHRRVLETWLSRLGYRLINVGSCYRLRREPIAGQLPVPSGGPPDRRPLVLVLAIAAVLEEVPGDSVTLQDISQSVAATTVTSGLAAYDPVKSVHRRTLIAAIDLLIDSGILERLTEEQWQRRWQEEGEGVGAGYVLHRDALLLLLDPRDVARALGDVEPPADDTRGRRLLRTLVETPGLFPTELDPDNQAYFANQRHRLIDQATEMTGATLEQHRDLVTLVPAPEEPFSAQATVGFPSASASAAASAWIALAMLDEAIHGSRPTTVAGFRRCPDGVVDAAATRLAFRLGSKVRKDLRDNPAAMRSAAEFHLVEVGAVRTDESGDWVLTPVAARYREAELSISPAFSGSGESEDAHVE